MSIRPLDMQVMLPKTQEVASIRHIDQQKSNLNQHNIANTVNQNIHKETKQVIKSGQNEKTYTRSDAKEKGKNKYQKHNKEDEKNKDNKKSNTYYRKRCKIDIKI